VVFGKVWEHLEVGVAQPGEGLRGAVGSSPGGLPIEEVEGRSLSGIPGVEEIGFDGFHYAHENDVGAIDLVANGLGQLAGTGPGRQREQNPEE
jgi:hypothetical protein